MKHLIKYFTLSISFYIVFALFPTAALAQKNDANFQEYYDQLSPFGQWIENSSFGYVWIPTADPDFTPYLTNGYWTLTNYGWMWVSGYEWGWAAFHYGRWGYNGYYGWFWVPDNKWGPSWVAWRKAEGYFGWAPMRPGVSISASYLGYKDVPNGNWTFINANEIENHDLANNHISKKNNIKIINSSTLINGTIYDGERRTTYVAGPDKVDVQNIVGHIITPVLVQEMDVPGQRFSNGLLQIYRPQAQINNIGYKQEPSKLADIKTVRRISQKKFKKKPQKILLFANATELKQQTAAPQKGNNAKNTKKRTLNKNNKNRAVNQKKNSGLDQASESYQNTETK